MTKNMLPRSEVIRVLILLGVTTLAYIFSFSASFHFDDKYVILEERFIQDIGNLPHILKSYLQRPLLRASFAINYYLSGEEVFGYHLVNFTLHLLAGVLLYILAKRLIAFFDHKNLAFENTKYIPFLSTAIFLLHPLHTGSVTYIASRSSVMATVFFMAAVLTYLKTFSIESYKKRYAINIIAFTLFILGLGAKEIVITAPLIVILLTFFYYKNTVDAKINKELLLRLLPWLSVIPLYLVLRLIQGGEIIPLDPRIDEELLSSSSYFLTELNVIALHYLRWFFLPFEGANVDPDIAFETSFLDLSTIISFIIISALSYLSLRAYRKLPILTFTALWFFITLLPTSSVIPLGDVAMERRMYLPSVGLSIAAATLLLYVFRDYGKKTILITTLVLLTLFGSLTLARNLSWASEVTLWEAAARKSPDKIRVLNNRAWGYYLEGDYKTALKYYLDLTERFPKYIYGRNNLALTHLKLGDIGSAVKEYRRAITLEPGLMFLRLNLAAAYEAADRADLAVIEYRRVLSINRGNIKVMKMLASALLKSGKFQEGITVTLEVLRRVDNKDKDNDAFTYYLLGFGYEGLGDIDRAAKAYSKALRLSPGWELPRLRLKGLHDASK